MTQPGPWGPPQYVPGFPPPKKSRTGWVMFAVIAVIALVAAGVAAVIVLRHENKPVGGSATSTTDSGPTPLHAIRLAAPNVATKPGSSEPKATLMVYEDFLCPFCRRFEQVYGPTIGKLVADGRIAVDYTMVSILGRGDVTSYSVRAGAAAYCVADADTAAFQRFHAALFAQQPDEMAESYPPDDELVTQAEKAGAPDSVAECITSGKYRDMVNHAVKSSGINSTPTVLLNGTDIGDAVLQNPDPQALLDQLKTVSG